MSDATRADRKRRQTARQAVERIAALSLLDEEWRAIAGFEGFYEVSDFGRVRRMAFASGAVVGRPLRGQIDRKGYAYVTLRAGRGRRRRRFLHHLVAEAFVAARPSSAHEINHKDARKLHNVPANLEWLDNAGNIAHSVATGLNPRGERAGGAKLLDDNVRAIRSQGGSPAVLARVYGVAPRTIRDVLNRKTWTHID